VEEWKQAFALYLGEVKGDRTAPTFFQLPLLESFDKLHKLSS
jgi:hypothetical protein